MVRDIIAGYLPAYVPVCLMFVKWFVLLIAGVYNPVAWFPDFTFALVSFDVWAVTAKLKEQKTLRLDGTISVEEGPLVFGWFFIHVVVYLFNVWAWLVSTALVWSVLSTFVAVISASAPFFVLGVPQKK